MEAKTKSRSPSPAAAASSRRRVIDVDVAVHAEENAAAAAATDSPRSPVASPTGGSSMKSARLTDTEIKFFNSIMNFVDDVNTYLSEINQRIAGVSKYNELLKHTRLVHKKNIRKHIAAFQEFIERNQARILKGNIEVFDQPLIFFSDNVHINMNDVMHKCDEGSKKVILEHLLNFRYLQSPSEDIRSALLNLMSTTAAATAESAVAATSNADASDAISADNPLGGIFDIINKNIDKEDPNPMNSIMKLIGSPAFGEIVSEVQRTAQSGGLSSILQALGGAGMGSAPN